MTEESILETIDGDFKLVYYPGPLSCSVAGGMNLEITTKSGEKEFIHLPPGLRPEKI